MSTVDPAAPRPGLRRRVVGALVILWPLVELALLIRFAVWFGLGYTLLLLLAGVVAGFLVLRHVGTRAMRRLGARRRGYSDVGPDARGADAVRPPRPGAETGLLVLAGLALIIPGILSDLLGLALLVPPVRRAAVRRIGDAVLARLSGGSIRLIRGEVLDDGADGPIEVRVTDLRFPEPGTGDLRGGPPSPPRQITGPPPPPPPASGTPGRSR